MADCEHAIRYMGMCADCGELVSDDDGSDDEGEKQQMVYCANGLAVSKKHAYKIFDTGRKRLVKERKLALILDLDKTLLHATADEQAESLSAIRVLTADQSGTEPYDQEDVIVKHTLGAINYYVKYRPGLIDFLHKASRDFELWIFTAGTRPYAVSNARVMDPDESLFGDRIVSRDDLPADYKPGRQVFKSLQAVFPFDDTFAIILDDSPDVWGSNMSNLLPVAPYTFFTGFEDVNNFTNTSSAGIQRKAKHDRKMLEAIWLTVQEARRRFFDNQPDIKEVLTQLKTSVLKSVCICFSGIISNRKTVQDHPVTKIAETFGATVVPTVTSDITHLVAKQAGTLKVEKAHSMPDVYIVTMDWLHDSIAYYSRQNERYYSLPERPVKRRKPLDS